MASIVKNIIVFTALAVILPTASCAQTKVLRSQGNEHHAQQETAVFAGGCFWGVEAVFEHVKGVTRVESGYSGGAKDTANYHEVSSGKTGHAESVRIIFDPTKISYEQLLSVFFAAAHDPTQLDRQGPDVGRQYRSVIFYADEKQKKSVLVFIDSINKSKALSKPVVTEVLPLEAFHEAESYHQDYLNQNPTDPYIVAHDLPKLENLKRMFPELYRKR